jgi:hypothetical protein
MQNFNIDYKIYVLAALSCIAFIGGIRLVCELLVALS